MSDAGEEREAPLDAEGPAAPPRKNGELVFDAPWQSRVFGVTMTLYGHGHFEWEEFRVRLIESIARAEAGHSPGDAYDYYGCWLEALEALLAAKKLCLRASLAERAHALELRAPGHDH